MVNGSLPARKSQNCNSGQLYGTGDGSTRCPIDIREADMMNEAALKALIRAAVALNISA
jgi:hypothetical protein